MSLSPTTPTGPAPTGSGPWLLRGRSPVWLIGLSALCGVGLAAAGMMLMRAADGAGVKDVVAELRRPGASSRSAAPASRTQPARTSTAALPPSESPARAPTPTEASASAKPSSQVSDAPTMAGPSGSSQAATLSPAAPPTSPAKSVSDQAVVTSQPTQSATTVASVPANPVPAAPVTTAPALPQTPAGATPVAPARVGTVVKREALSPVKPQRAASSLPAATPQASAARERKSHNRDTAAASVPAGLRAIAAPAGSAANVRAYTMATDGPSVTGSTSGVRIVRVEVPGAR